MSKKVGIITFHRADNLGAVLQAYALQTAISQRYDAETEIIDYRSAVDNVRYQKFTGIKGLVLQGYYFWKHMGFEYFRRKYLRCSQPCFPKDLEWCTREYDVLITGSDQVWNYECSDWDNAFFLDFAPSGKKYAYAASLGNYRFLPEEKVHVKRMLEDFSGISVRESSAKEVIRELGIPKVEICPDPVLLLGREQWLKILPTRICAQRYVFVYLIQQDVNVLRCAEAYAGKHNCKIINNKTSPEFILRGAPLDFLAWIYFAEGIFTNSFHGTAFALLFNKPLAADICLATGGINCRIKELLETVGGEECVCGEAIESLHSAQTENKLEAMRQRGFQYLDQINGV